MELKDGGPAFPASNHMGQNLGMSLRDWFAGQALMGIIAAEEPLEQESLAMPDATAKWAYNMADAMIAWRGKVQGEKEVRK